MELGELKKVVDEIVDEIVDEKPKRKKRPTVAQMRELERQIVAYQRTNMSLSERVETFHALTRELQSAQDDLMNEQRRLVVENQKLREQIGMHLGDQREANEFVERLRRQNDELHRKVEHLTKAIGHMGSAMQDGFAAKGGR